MLDILAHRTYCHLFCAQVIALIGTGLATVALALLAGENAGAVLGTALAIKMAAYVGVAPVAVAFAERLPRRMMLVALDLVRAAVALLLPFVTEIWHVYVLIFVLQSASAAFTPTFQATIPDVLPDEKEYTRALSLSRLAYDLESLLSPMLAAALLTVVRFHALFAGTVVGFLVSAALVVSVVLPNPRASAARGIHGRTTRGLRTYLSTPRLRGLLGINMTVASAGALIIVNTVVFVQGEFGLGPSETALALATFGGGSVLAALALPPLLDNMPDRTVMLAGACAVAVGALAAAAVTSYAWMLLLWIAIGAGYYWRRHRPGGCCAAQPIPKTDRRCLRLSSRCRMHAGSSHIPSRAGPERHLVSRRHRPHWRCSRGSPSRQPRGCGQPRIRTSSRTLMMTCPSIIRIGIREGYATALAVTPTSSSSTTCTPPGRMRANAATLGLIGS